MRPPTARVTGPELITMTPYESDVDRQIREAQEAGAFDNLRGAGQPIPGLSGRHDPNWWVNQWVQREDLSGVLPPSLALRRAIEELPETVAGERDEARVREIVGDLNTQIRHGRIHGLDGPQIFLQTQDVERVVREWKERRAPRMSAGPEPEPVAEPARGFWARLRERLTAR